jgi:hypothetical protein
MLFSLINKTVHKNFLSEKRNFMHCIKTHLTFPIQ